MRQELIEYLRAATTPDGEPVFETVGPREEYFSGPHTEGAVDVVTVPDGFEHFPSAQLLGEQFGDSTEPWNHELDGIFAAYGEGVDPDSATDDAHLFDVAPTVLAALGVPVSDRMDGRILPHVPATEVTSYPAYDTEERTLGDDAAVQDRLADLGYLE